MFLNNYNIRIFSGNRGLVADILINQPSYNDFYLLDTLNVSSPAYIKYHLSDGVLKRNKIPKTYNNILSRIKGFFTAPYTGMFRFQDENDGYGGFISTNTHEPLIQVRC